MLVFVPFPPAAADSHHHQPLGGDKGRDPTLAGVTRGAGTSGTSPTYPPSTSADDDAIMQRFWMIKRTNVLSGAVRRKMEIEGISSSRCS